MMKKLLPLSILCFVGMLLHGQTFSRKQNVTLRSHVPYTNKDCANICGYASNGREYALMGFGGGTAIIEVTNPDAPKLIKEIPAVYSRWREIKVYKNLAYITTEGTGQGLQIVDLSTLPDTNVVYKSYKGGDSTLVSIDRAHALHIDEAKGFCYLYGGISRIKPTDTSKTTINVNGAVVLDLKDPWNPKFAGVYSNKYIHDGFVYNDTVYAAHSDRSFYTIIDFTNKKAPVEINTIPTLVSIPHNTWLSDSRKILFTTAEGQGSYMASYDISDIRNIKLLDKIRSSSEQFAVGHNTHILNDYAVTSWYTEGFTIVDAKRPKNLVQVAQYDTYDGTINDNYYWRGAWGVYPFLPSGTILVSNIEDGLYVLTPQYKRACYLEGNVVDSITNQPLGAVRVAIASTDMDKKAESDIQGNYYTGQVTNGTFDVTYSKTGYYSKTVRVALASGQVTIQNIKLSPISRINVAGRVVDNTTSLPVANAQVVLALADQSEIKGTTNAQGNFLIENVYDFGTPITAYAGAWGFKHKKIAAYNNGDVIRLEQGYQDDFWADFGWTIGGTIPLSSTSSGKWERVVPVQSTFNNTVSSPAKDLNSDMGNQCFITGNGGNNDDNDVDGGSTILKSPAMKLRNYSNPVLSFSYWFYNSGGAGVLNDKFTVTLSNGVKDTIVRVFFENTANWLDITGIKIKDYLALTDSMWVSFTVNDDSPAHIIEAGLDGFSITQSTSNIEIVDNWELSISPNPYSQQANINFKLLNKENKAQLKVYNIFGQIVLSENLSTTEGGIKLGEDWPSGVYFVRIESQNKVSKIHRFVKN